jgi:ABC-type branched-subunit amino acid transport system ATPase component
MDEPAAGLTSGEIDELEEVIVGLRDAGIAILLVEHHVEFVLGLADLVTVIDFGQVIARGAPDVVRNDPIVITAYLGEDEESDELSTPIGVNDPAGEEQL